MPICTASDDQQSPQLVSGGAGEPSSPGMTFVARTMISTLRGWTPAAPSSGVLMAYRSAPLRSWQWCPQLVSDGAGGAIITWDDLRSENYDIYAQRVDYNGGFTELPTQVPSPVTGPLEVIGPTGSCSNIEWCFNQHQTGAGGIGHIPGGGIGKLTTPLPGT